MENNIKITKNTMDFFKKIYNIILLTKNTYKIMEESNNIKENDIYQKISPRNIIIEYINNYSINNINMIKNINLITRIDVVVILYIVNKLGFYKDKNYKYLYVDEAQDYNDVEINLINIMEEPNSINIFGDIEQNISHNSLQRENWNSLVNKYKFKIYNLTENYRNTPEIVQYCNEELNVSMKAIGKSGSEVKIEKHNNFEDIVKLAKETDSIIICSNKIKQLLVEKEMLKETSNILFSVKEVKGLEFEKVIVINNEMNRREKYVAYTRALRDLYIAEIG